MNLMRMLMTLDKIRKHVEAGEVDSMVIAFVTSSGDIQCFWSDTAYLTRVGLSHTLIHNMTVEEGEE